MQKSKKNYVRKLQSIVYPGWLIRIVAFVKFGHRSGPHWDDLPKLLSIRETAHLLKVHPNTLRLWDQRGQLRAIRIGTRQDRRYQRDVVHEIWKSQRRPSAEDVVSTWMKRQEQLHRLERHFRLPLLVVVGSFLLFTVIGALRPAQADSAKRIQVTLQPNTCTGWEGANAAKTIDNNASATPNAFTNKNSAKFFSPDYKVSSKEKAVVTAELNSLEDTITCDHFSLNGLNVRSTISDSTAVISFYRFGGEHSTGNFHIDISTDGQTWSTEKIVPADKEAPSRIEIPLGKQTRESLLTYRFRIVPDFDVDTPPVTAWLDGVGIVVSATNPVNIDVQKNKKTKADLDRLVDFSKTTFQSIEEPIITVPKKEVQKVLFVPVRNITWTLDEVTLKDTNQGESFADIHTADRKSGGNVDSVVSLVMHDRHPGKYVVTVAMHNSDGGEATIQREILWGVVAVNFDRPNPRPKEKVQVGLAVLDDAGKTICDANITVRVTDPRGQVKTFSEKKKNLTLSGQCVDKGVTNIPDYGLTIIPDRLGTYHVSVVAKTSVGERRIEENILVEGNSPFDVQRSDFPTRIYPPAEYSVTFSVTPENNFSGIITEQVPGDFQVSNIFPTGTLLQSSNAQTPQRIQWSADWEAGKTYYFRYSFKAPDISPALFKLGHIAIAANSLAGSLWQESRFWQLASDSISARASGFAPSSGTLVTGSNTSRLAATASANTGVNTGSYLGTLAEDNLHWTVVGANANPNIDVQLNFDSVDLGGANKIIIQTRFDTDANLNLLFQICDWTSSTSVDNAADSQCTTGGWRTLNSQNASNADFAYTGTTSQPFQWHIYDGYFTTGTTGGTAVSTPLTNFISGSNQIKIRYFSTTASATNLDIDYLRVIPIIDPVYVAAGFTQITGGTPAGTYINTNVIGNSASAPWVSDPGTTDATAIGDAVYLAVPGTGSAISDFYLSYKNVQTYTGANTIYVRSDFSCSTTGINITPKIYNFNSTAWENLTSTAIACSATDATRGWAKNNVTISNYISSGEIRVGWFGSANNTLSIRIDAQYVMIGTTNTDSSKCEVSFGTGTATNCTNTRDLDQTGTTNVFANPASDESNTFGNDFYPLDNDGDATTEEAAASNITFSVTPPTGAKIMSAHFAGRYSAGTPATTTALAVRPGLFSYGGQVTSGSGNGGWVLFGPAATSTSTAAASVIYRNTDSVIGVTSNTSAVWGIFNNPATMIDWTNNTMNARLQTTASGTTTNNVTVNWDFAMVSLSWINTTTHPDTGFQYAPTRTAEVTAGAATARLAATANSVNGVTTAVTTGGWKALQANDNFHWSPVGAGASGLNVYADTQYVQLHGANKIIIQTEMDQDATTPSMLIQICDWVSSTSVDNAADSQCTGGGWRSLNSVNASNAEVAYSGATAVPFFQWQIYDGYWSTGTTGGTPVSTPLSNFINGSDSNNIRIRFFSSTNHTSLTNIDYLYIAPVIDSIYHPAGFTQISGGTPTGTYMNAMAIGNTATAQQSTATTNAAGNAVYLQVPGTAGAISDFYFSFTNIKQGANMNAIYVRSEYSCSTTGVNIKPKIYNFKLGAWEDLTSSAITCSATDAMGAWAKNNVVVRDYTQNGEMRVGWYGSGNNTLSIRIDDIFIALGSVNSDSAQCSITMGSGTATNCTNTRDIDTTGSLSAFANAAVDESNTFGNDFIGMDSDADATAEDATAANINFSIKVPDNAITVGQHFAGRFAAGFPNTTTAQTIQMGLRDYSGVPGLTTGATTLGGYAAIGATAAAAAGSDSYTLTDSISSLTANLYGLMANPQDNLDLSNDVANIRLRTTAGGTSTNNPTTQWDFAFVSEMWVENQGVTISGNVYSDETPTFMNCTTPKTVRVKINGAGDYSGSCTGASGSYTVSNVPVPYADAQITVYLDGVTEKGSVSTIANSGTANITNLHIYQDRVVVTHEDAGPNTNTDIRLFDSGGDADVQFTGTGAASGPTITVASGDEFHVVSGKTYTAGGALVTNATGGALHVLGTATLDVTGNSIGNTTTIPSGGTLRINADTTLGGTVTVTSTGAITTTAGTPTVTMSATSSITGTGNTTFYNLQTSGTAVLTYDTSGTNTINNTITAAAGTTVNLNSSISIANGLINATSGVIGTSAGTPTVTMTGATPSIGGGTTGAVTIYALATSGTGTTTLTNGGTNTISNNVTVGTGTTLNINSSVSIAGNLVNTTTGIIGTSAGTPTVTLTGTSASLGGGSGAITFYSLTANGTNSTVTVNSDATVSNTLTVGGDANANTDVISIASSKTLSATGTTTITDASDTVSGSGTLRFTDTSSGPGSTGTLSSGVRFDASSANIANTTFDARTYGGAVELYSNAGTGKSISTASGTYVFSSTLTVTTAGAAATTFDMDTTDPTTFTVTGTLTIGTTSVLSATSSGTFNINGNYVNSGIFTHNSGTVTAAGSAQQDWSGTLSGSTGKFNNLVITNAFGNGTSTWSVTFAGNAETAATFTATTPDTKLRFNATSTYTFQNFTVDGQATGTRVFLRSSSGGSAWLLNVAGTSTVANTNVQDSNASGSASPIDCSGSGSCFNATGNTNWVFVIAGITISGTIYQSGAEGSAFDCNAANITLHVSTNGGTNKNGTCSAANGTFSISGVTDPGASDIPIVVFSDSASSNKLTTVTLSSAGGANITGLSLMIGRVVITQESATVMTNTLLGTADNADAGIRYAVSGGNLTVESGMELHVLAGKSFTPGGTVTTTSTGTAAGPAGDIHVPATATLTMGTNALSVGGDLTNAGTLSISSGQTTTFTATGTGFTITSGGATMDGMTFNGSGGGWTNSGALTMNGSFTGTAGGFTQANSTVVSVFGTAFSLANGFTWTKATSGANLIIDNATNLDFTDSNTTKQDLGVLQIGASPGVTTLKSDLSATTVTIPTADTFKTKGYEVTTSGAFDCQGTCTLDLTDTAPNNEGDGTILDIGGDFTMSSSATFTSYTNSKLFMNSTSGSNANRTWTTGGKAYNDVELKNAGTTNDQVILSGNLDVNGTFTLTDGTIKADTNNPTTNTAGNVSIASAATYTKGTGAWTFDGTTATTYTDSTATPQNIGAVTINKTDTGAPSTNDKVTLASSMTVDTMTIDGTGGQADTLNLASSGYTLQLANAGATGTVLTVSGTLTPGSNSTVQFSATNSGGNVTVPATTYNALKISGNETYDLGGNLTGGNAVTGAITIDAGGATLDATNANNYNIALAGDWNNNGTFTARTGTVTMTGTSNLQGSSATTFNNLTIDGANTTVTVGTSDPIVNATLTIGGATDGDNDTLSIGSGRSVILAGNTGTTLTFNDASGGTNTISGAGTLVYRNSATTMTTAGVVNSLLQFDLVNGTMSAPARTYGGGVTVKNGSGAARTLTLGTGASQTLTFSSYLDLQSTAASSTLVLAGDTNNPTLNITGDFTTTTATAAVTVNHGSGTWTVSGNYSLANVTTFANNSGTLVMNGTSKTLTSNGLTLFNVTLSGTITLANATHTLSGNLSLAGGTITAGTSTILMNGTGGKTITGGGQSLYALNIDPSSAGTITLQTSDLTVANQLTVATGDTLSISSGIVLTNTFGTNVSLSGTISGAGTLRFTDTSGGPGTTGVLSSIVRYDASAANIASTTVDARQYRGRVELYSNSGSARSITYPSGNFTCSGTGLGLYTYADGAGNLTIDTATNNPTGLATCGTFDFIGGGGGSEIFNAGTGNISLSDGDFNVTGGTFTTNGTLTFLGATQTLTTGGNTIKNLTVTSSDFIFANETITVSGNIDLTGAANITPGTSVVVMTGTANTVDTAGWSFYDLTIDPATTGTITANIITVNHTLTVASGDTLSIQNGGAVYQNPNASTALVLNGTISGLGEYWYSGSANFPSSGSGGSISAPVWFDATATPTITLNGSVLSTYGGIVVFDHAVGTGRSLQLGSAASQTFTFSSDLQIRSDGTGSSTIDGATNNPTVNVSGNIIKQAGDPGTGSLIITSGTGNWTVGGNVNLTGITYTAATGNTLTMNGTAKTLTSAGNSLYNFTQSGGTVTMSGATSLNNNLTISSGTLTAPSAANLTVAGDFSNSGTFTHNSGTVIMTGTSKNITGSAATTFNNLTISGTTTVAAGGSDATVATVLQIDTSKSLTIGTGRLVTLSRSATAQSLTLNGTLNGPGTLVYQLPTSVAAFPTTGTLAAAVVIRFDTVNGDQSISQRSDYASVVAYKNATTARVVTLGTAGSQTLSFSGSVDVFNSNATGSLTLTGATNNPTVNITTNFTNSTATGATVVSMGSGTWTVNGSFDLSNVGTFNHNSGTLTMGGTGTVTSNGKTLNHLTTSGSGTVTLANAAHTLAGNLTLGASSTFTMGSATPSVAGNVTLAGTVNANTSTLTMTGAGTSLTGGNATLANLTISNTTGSVTLSTSDVTVNTLLTVSGSGGSLTLASGRTMTLSRNNASNSFTLSGTLNGPGTLIYQNATANAFPTGGTLAAAPTIRFDTVNGTLNVPARTDYGTIVAYKNTATTSTVIVGTAAAQTITASGTIDIQNGNATNGLTLDAATNNPTVNVTGSVTNTVATGATTLSLGSGTWTVSANFNLTNLGTLNASTGKVVMAGTGTLTSNGKTLNNLDINSSGTVTLAAATHTLSGNLLLGGSGTPTVTGSTIVMTGASKTIDGGGKTIAGLTLSNDTTLQNTDLSVSGALNVADTKTFTINASRSATVTSTGSLTFNSTGTITSPSTGTLIYQPTAAFPTGGTISSQLRMDTTFNAQTLSARTYDGQVEVYNSSNGYNLTLGTASSQTLNFSSNFLVSSNSGADLQVLGDTNNPTVNITGNLDFTGTGSYAEVIASGTGTWTVSGNVDLTGGVYGPSVKLFSPAFSDTAVKSVSADSFTSCAIGPDSYFCSGQQTQHGHTNIACIDSFQDGLDEVHRGWMQFSPTTYGASKTILSAFLGLNVSVTYSANINVGRSSVDNLNGQDCNSSIGTYSKIGGAQYGTVSLSTTGEKLFSLGTTGVADIQSRSNGGTDLTISLGSSTIESFLGTVNSQRLIGTYYSSGTPTLVMNGTSKTLTSAGNTFYNLTLSGSITLANETHSIGNNLDLTAGTITAGTSTVQMVGTAGTLTAAAGGSTLAGLTIDPASAGTITLAAGGGNLTVSSLLTTATGDTFSIGSGRTVTLSGNTGTTLTNNGTISGSGTLIYQNSATTMTTAGTLSTPVTFDMVNGSMNIPNRTFGGAVVLKNGSGAARTATLGTAASQTLTFSSSLDIQSTAASSTLVVAGNTNNPTVNVTGDVTNSNATAATTLSMGSGTWTVSGNFNLTNVGTFNHNSGSLTMNGASKTLTTNAKTVNNLTFSGTGTTTLADSITADGSVVLNNTVSAGSTTLTMQGTSKTLTGASATINNLTIQTGSITMSGIITLNGNMLISSGSFTADSASAFTVKGNWTNSGGTYNEGTGTVTFAGTTSTTLNSGCANTDTCTNENFYSVTINKTAGVGANDDVTLTSNGIRLTNLLTITAGEFVQGALNVRAEGTAAVSVGASGIWTNISTGDLKLGGTFVNAGSVTFNSNNGTQCTDTADDIVITSTTGGTQRAWSGAGTFTIYNVNVTDMTGSVTAYTSTFSNTTWTVGSCGITVSGNIYTNDATTALDCSTGGTRTVAIKVNGAGTATGTCTLSSGAYSVAGVTIGSAGDVVTVFISGATEKAVTVTLANNTVSNITSLPLRTNRLVVTHESAGPITNSATTGIGRYDKDDDATNFFFTANANNLSLDAGKELVVNTGKTYTPGGTVTTAAASTSGNPDGDVLVQSTATLAMGTNALSIGGDATFTGSFTKSATQTTTFTATGSGFTITPNGNFANIDQNGSAGIYTAQGAIVVDENLTVTAGTFAMGANALTVGSTGVTNSGTIKVASGQSLTQSSGSTTTILSSAAGANCIGSNGASCAGTVGTISLGGLTIGDATTTFTTTFGGTTPALTTANTLTVTANATFTAGASTLNVAGSFTNNGTFSQSGGALVMNGTGTLTTNGNTLNDFTTSGSGTITLANATHTFAGSLSLGSTGFTAGTSTVVMTGTKNLIGGGKTLNNLTINGTNTTVSVITSDVTVSGILLIGGDAAANTDTLSIGSGRTVTSNGTGTTTITDATDTISGAGTLLVANSNLGTTGTLSSIVQFGFMTGSPNPLIVPARTYGGNVSLTGGTTSKTLTLGSAGSQTLTFQGNLSFDQGGAGLLTVAGNTWNPTVNLTGNLSGNAGNQTLALGSGIWTVSGNIDFSGLNNTISHNSGTVVLNGSSQQTITTATNTLNNLTITNTSGSDPDSSPSVILADSLTTAGTLTATTANTKLRFNAGSTYAPNAINFNGQATGTRVTLRSSTPGTAVTFNAGAGSRTVSNTSIKDSNACGSNGGSIDASDGTNVDETNTNCWLINTLSVSLSGTSINLTGVNPFDTSHVNYQAVTSTVTTNAANGYVSVVSYSGPMSFGSDTLADAGGTVTPGTSGFGVSTSKASQSIATTTAPSCTTTQSQNTSSYNASSLSSVTPAQFASSAGAASSDLTTLCFLGAISGTQAPGSYSTTVTLVTTARF